MQTIVFRPGFKPHFFPFIGREYGEQKSCRCRSDWIRQRLLGLGWQEVAYNSPLIRHETFPPYFPSLFTSLYTFKSICISMWWSGFQRIQNSLRLIFIFLSSISPRPSFRHCQADKRAKFLGASQLMFLLLLIYFSLFGCRARKRTE